jgi:hypothetical protein
MFLVSNKVALEIMLMFGFLAPVWAKTNGLWAFVALHPWSFAATLAGLTAVAAVLHLAIPTLILGCLLGVLLMWKSEAHTLVPKPPVI